MSTVIKPFSIEESNLISCTIPVDADSSIYGSAWKGEWVSGSYSQGDIVYSGIILYESLVDSNADSPEYGVSLEVATWLEIGKINRWRAFDEFISNSSSSATDEMEYVLSVTDVDNIAFYDLVANDISVKILNSDDDVVWEYSYCLIDEIMDFGDWWEYYYAPYPDPRRDLVVELGWLVNSALGEKVKITISGVGQVSCGLCIVGYGEDLGRLQWEFSGGDISYSNTTTDQWGRDSFVKGPSAKLISGSIKIPAGSESYVYRLLSSLKGQPVVFNLNNPGIYYDMLSIYGVIKDHSHVAYSRNKAICSITIRGLI